jgi:hypothetical protein
MYFFMNFVLIGRFLTFDVSNMPQPDEVFAAAQMCWK